MSYYNGQVDPMGVIDPTSLSDRLFHEVDPTQYIRELIRNMIEAGATVGRIDVDTEYYAQTGQIKLRFTDDGCGMSENELVSYIGNLAAGAKTRGEGMNYGIGAKISLALNNPNGSIYRSYTKENPDGAEVVFAKDTATDSFGLRRAPIIDENDVEVLSTSWSPESRSLLRGSKTGTSIRLDGKSDDDNTAVPPQNVSGGGHWLHVKINERFFRFPENFKLRAIRWSTGDSDQWGDKQHHHVDTVHGKEYVLDKNALTKGSMDVHPTSDAPSATIHWWLLNPNGNSDPRHRATGHFGWLHRDELYELNRSLSSMREFGFSSIGRRVVIYIEPHGCEPNIGRTFLLDNGKTVNQYLEDYQIEFVCDMPPELAAADKEATNSRVSQITPDEIKRYLKKQRENIPFAPHFTRDSTGGVLVNEGETSNINGHGGTGTGISQSVTGTGTGTGGKGSGSGTGTPGPVGGKVDPSKKRIRAKRRNADANATVTIILTNERDNEDLKGHAAAFTITKNEILLNQDYYLYGALHERARDARFEDDAVWEAIKSYTGLKLAVAISSVKQLKSSGQWTEGQFKHSVDKEALTTAVELGRSDILADSKRALGSKFGKATSA